MGILQACTPRQDIISGNFNPEIFTASLSEVLEHYRKGASRIHSIYTDAGQFFTEATYPTDGMKNVLSGVFARIRGDGSAPALHRLETAFGGGKTHTLIACAHIAFKGEELAPVVSEIMQPKLLPRPGEINVVGIAGDSIPVHRPKGQHLVPYTLWGEIAFQIGGEELYRQVEEIASSYAAPGKYYFDQVLGDRKVLIMLDELAQYSARLACAHPNGAEQLAAFLMALHGYARKNTGLAIVLTLASAQDAFARQTEQLARLLSQVTGKDLDHDDALAIGQAALKGITSVVSRDASLFVPVQAAEISKVLGKRLFDFIDHNGALKTVQAYQELYAKNRGILPDLANRSEYLDQMAAHYPFHPTLIDFLNNKLAVAEEFQGTRGVLRVLALAVRSIWEKGRDLPMIHACHLDLRDARTVNEIIGRTGSGDLIPVLNADIGGVETSQGIEGGKSNAELADSSNPHPDGWPMYEYAWKTVFLHSLVERDRGLDSNIFGLTEQDAVFNVSFPGLPPVQVQTALKAIEDRAYYLRFENGRYYASLEPSVNIALARIRRGLTSEEIDELLATVARKVVSEEIRTFKVFHDVTAPEHIPDGQGKPCLALISLMAEGPMDPEEFIVMAGPMRPRIEQNLVFLLVPDTVSIKEDVFADGSLPFDAADSSQARALDALRGLARTVLAMHRLKKRPDSYGINPTRLNQKRFNRRFSEREMALQTSVTQAYSALWFPSASGKTLRKEIRTAGGESGVPVIEQIRKVLLEEGELVTSEHTGKSHLMDLSRLFFATADTAGLKELRKNFCQKRTWPILENPGIFDQVIRQGVSAGVWCLFYMAAEDATSPEEFYSAEAGVPFNLDLARDYSIVTVEGAKKRGWLSSGEPDPQRIRKWVKEELSKQEEDTIAGLLSEVNSRHGQVPDELARQAVQDLLEGKKAVALRPDSNDVIWGPDAAMYVPADHDVIMTPRRAAIKGIITPPSSRGISLTGRQGVRKLKPVLAKLGSLFSKGAKSRIDLLDLADLKLPHGGRLRIAIEDAGPDSMKELDELFEVIAQVVQMDDKTEADIEINDPVDDCILVKALEDGQDGRKNRF